MQQKPLLVLKLGSTTITTLEGKINEPLIVLLAQQMAILQEKYRLVIVSSGAVAAGKSKIIKYKGSLIERKMAAAVGNPILMNTYSKIFGIYGITVAQSLCERRHFAQRNQFLQLKSTFEELWKHKIIPIVNENDVVSDVELRFSDNDELATLVAVGFEATYLLFCTSVGGLLDKNNEIVPKIDIFTPAVFSLANTEKSVSGLGGMTSKLSFAKLSTQMNINTILFMIDGFNSIQEALEGKRGTFCVAQERTLSAHKKWLSSGGIITGKIKVDLGAKKALLNRKSLLAVGVLEVIGNFEKGEIIEILDEKNTALAVAVASESSVELARNTKKHGVEVAHADRVVLL